MAAATNPLTYNGYLTQVAGLAVYNTQTVSGVVQGVDAAFNNQIPMMLNYAELRIQRDMNLLPAQTSSSAYSLTSGSNLLQISVNDFVIVDSIVVNGTPLVPTTKEFLQNCYGPGGTQGQPQYFAMYGGDQLTGGNTYNNIIVGPYPNANYSTVVTGTQCLPSLYAYANITQANTATTFISTYLPDLLIMASLIYISAYQRNFGRQADDPQMAQSYESQYQLLLKGADSEEARKRFAADAWSAAMTSPVATSTR